MPSYSQKLPEEGSWRVVDGENDSFDTSILPSASFEEDPYFAAGYPSSGQPSSALPSQISSLGGGHGSAESQDSIRDFSRHHEDENVILRDPFRPTMSRTLSSPTRKAVVRRRQRIFQEEPSMAEDETSQNYNEGRISGQKNSMWSNNTIEHPSRIQTQDGAPYNLKSQTVSAFPISNSPTVSNLRTRSSFNVTSILWTLSILIVMLLLIGYVVIASIIIFRNLTEYPLSLATLPLCHLPVIGIFIPCPKLAGITSTGASLPCVDFGDFASAHIALEDVAGQQHEFVALPSEAEQADPALDHLRSVLEADTVAHKKRVLRAFDEYNITSTKIRHGVRDIQASITMATRKVSALAESVAQNIESSLVVESSPTSASARFTSWLFSPLRIPKEEIDSYLIRQLFDEHAEQLLGVVARLRQPMAHIANLLNEAGHQVRIIIYLTPEPPGEVDGSQGTLGFNLWTLLAVKNVQLSQVHRSLTALNKLVVHHSNLTVRTRHFAQDLDALERDLKSKRTASTSAASSTRHANRECGSKEAQVEYLRRTAAQLRSVSEALRHS